MYHLHGIKCIISIPKPLSEVDCLPLHVQIISGFKLKPFHLLAVPCVDLLYGEGEPGADFLHVYALVALSKYVSVVAEEDKVALVVEGHHSPSSELRLLREQRSQQSTYSHSHSGVEVVED